MNYLLWGEMNYLGGYTLQKAVTYAVLWKMIPVYGWSPISTEQAIVMTVAGYNNGALSGAYGFNCEPNVKYSVPRDDSDWKWWPLIGHL